MANVDLRLKEMKAGMEALLDIIEKVEAVIGDISDLPETVETDLREEEEQVLLNIKAAYDALSEHEKSLVSKDTVEKLENLLEMLVDYKMIQGDGSKWTKGSGKNLTFTANGPYRKFAYIEVDGKKLDADFYTAKSGNTVIRLKASYLEELEEGKHTITVYYTDGEADGTFQVLKAPAEETESTARANEGDSAATDDTTNIVLWITLMCLSALGMILLLVKGRRRFIR